MKPTTSRLENILSEAVEIASTAERQAFLDVACAGSVELRAQVDRMVANHFRAGSFLEHPAAGLETAPFSHHDDALGTKVGPYKLLEQIGEGGMGLVFVAEQQHPVRRSVALKLIKPGMDSKQVIARFEAERQALALMDHPNIAKVLDAGTTDAGRPYFVMELVRGIPITEYCDQARFTVRQRLDVFVLVCRAVQHAHTKGVIHRDLKPSNVLVTSHDGVPVPVVIDFGVAKALGQQLTDKSLHTAFSQMVGTPLYMSPEQAEYNQLGVDTRSDIYSLGVLLYELLTGVTPFDQERLRTASHDEFRRILREEEPPRPSARLSTLEGARRSTASERRSVDPRKLSQTLHGELDWIVLKSLEKDRNRRYETASAFAADVQRYLNDESVEACPPTKAYRLRKFARRYRRSLATAGVIAIALVTATVVSAWQAVLAKRAARAEAEQSRRKEKNLELALQALDQVYLHIAEDRLPMMKTLDRWDRELLQRALAFYEKFTQENDDSPGARHARAKALIRVAQLRSTLGLPDPDPAESLHQAIHHLEDLTAEFPENLDYRFTCAGAYGTLGDVFIHRAEYSEAENCYRRAESLFSDLIHRDPDQKECRKKLATVYMAISILLSKTERRLESQKAAQQSFEAYQQLSRDFPNEAEYRRGMGQYHANRAVELAHAGQAAAAQKSNREAIRIYGVVVRESKDPLDNYALARCMQNLAVTLKEDSLPEQEDLLRRSQSLWKQLAQTFPQVGDYQFQLAGNHIQLATVLQETGRSADAEKSYALGLQVMEQSVAVAPEIVQYRIELGGALSNRGIQLRNRGQLEQARDMFQRAIEQQTIAREKDPLDPTARRFLSIHYSMLGTTLQQMGNHAKAAECLAKSAEVDPKHLDSSYFLAWLLLTCPDARIRNPAKALEAAVRATKGNPDDGTYWGVLGAANYRTGDYSEAIKALKKAESRGGDESAWVGLYMCMALWQSGKKTDSRARFARVEKLLEYGPDDEELWRPAYAEAAKLLGVQVKSVRHSDGDPTLTPEERSIRQDEEKRIKYAEARWEESVKQRGVNDPSTLEELRRLVDVYDSACHWDAAIKAMKQVVEAKKINPGPDHPDTLAAMKRLGGIYRRAGYWTEGLALYKDLIERATTKLGAENVETLSFKQEQGGFLRCCERVREAIPLLEHVSEVQKMKSDSRRWGTLQHLGWAYYWDGRPEDAERVATEVLDGMQKAGLSGLGASINSMSIRGLCLLARKQFADAEKVLRACLTLIEKAQEPEWNRYRVMNQIGAALAGQNKAAEAEGLLLEGYEGMKRNEERIPAPWRPHFIAAGENVLHFYQSTGATGKAEFWREKLAKSSPSKK